MTWEFSKSQKAKVIGQSRETIFQQDKLQYKILIDLNFSIPIKLKMKKRNYVSMPIRHLVIEKTSEK